MEEVKPHPSLSQLYAGNKMLELAFSPLELPMVCPPLPWLSARTGAYLLRTNNLVRVSAGHIESYAAPLWSLLPPPSYI